MPKQTELSDLDMLYEALGSEVGIIVRSDNPQALRGRLYKLRRENSDLAPIAILTSPTDDAELWIVKKDQAPDAET